MSAVANSNPQYMAALDTANLIRTERANLKRDVKAGRISPAEVVRECDNGLSLFDLLRSIHRMGPHRARVWMKNAGINENVVLGGERHNGLRPITDREREAIASLLERL